MSRHDKSDDSAEHPPPGPARLLTVSPRLPRGDFRVDPKPARRLGAGRRALRDVLRKERRRHRPWWDSPSPSPSPSWAGATRPRCRISPASRCSPPTLLPRRDAGGLDRRRERRGRPARLVRRPRRGPARRPPPVVVVYLRVEERHGERRVGRGVPRRGGRGGRRPRRRRAGDLAHEARDGPGEVEAPGPVAYDDGTRPGLVRRDAVVPPDGAAADTEPGRPSVGPREAVAPPVEDRQPVPRVGRDLDLVGDRDARARVGPERHAGHAVDVPPPDRARRPLGRVGLEDPARVLRARVELDGDRDLDEAVGPGRDERVREEGPAGVAAEVGRGARREAAYLARDPAPRDDADLDVLLGAAARVHERPARVALAGVPVGPPGAQHVVTDVPLVADELALVDPPGPVAPLVRHARDQCLPQLGAGRLAVPLHGHAPPHDGQVLAPPGHVPAVVDPDVRHVRPAVELGQAEVVHYDVAVVRVRDVALHHEVVPGAPDLSEAGPDERRAEVGRHVVPSDLDAVEVPRAVSGGQDHVGRD
ncbi:hypothetical protein THAOC_16679 [Thalassiosira oceanica]|uniref:Uncharacterized protein n=1 Tax=Thalassiosira oceanica TaxID=159749 RepID=K0S9C4_THAOC|nr:hypothetical protein THAOC_16679 [Thalassiosira oceanica]|eukprot:EJK62698.1 hypothetical protein THAOC_16679 [Thalassiosira oceanica]